MLEVHNSSNEPKIPDTSRKPMLKVYFQKSGRLIRKIYVNLKPEKGVQYRTVRVKTERLATLSLGFPV